MTRSRPSWPWWRCVLTGLSALALAMSAYLSWQYLVGGSVIGCGGDGVCDQVLSSRWSAVAGLVPVSGLAAGVYLAILVATFFIGPSTTASDRRLAWGAMQILAGAAAGSAVWFTVVQKWVLGAFCPLCMTTHVTGLFLAALIIWQARLQFDHAADFARSGSARKHYALTGAPLATNGATGLMMTASIEAVSATTPRRSIGRLVGVGVVLAGILAVCQIGIAPPSVYRTGESQNTLPAINSHSVPLVGPPDARYIVTVLFDYKCPHCQQLHFMLDEAIRRYDGKLAFALCPAPLNTQCNPYIPRDVDEFKGSCDLAKIGLAVWAANREAFPEFDRWMYSLDSGDRWSPRSLGAATAKAIELVGQAKFDAASSGPLDRPIFANFDSYLRRHDPE